MNIARVIDALQTLWTGLEAAEIVADPADEKLAGVLATSRRAAEQLAAELAEAIKAARAGVATGQP